jgi:hypothetical protein
MGDKINMNLQEVGWDIDWIDVAQDKKWRVLMKAVMNLWGS